MGLAIGDSLGAPVEHLSLAQIHERYGVNGIRDFDEFHGFPEGSYTDDTQMSIATARGLIDAQVALQDGEDADRLFMVYNRYLEWLESQDDPDQRRGPGATCLAALRSGTVGTIEEKINDSKGCGGVMRTAPVGLAFPAGSAFIEGARFAAITHGHPSGYLTAGFLSEMIANLLEGASLEESVANASDILIDHEGHEETLKSIDLAVNLAASRHTVEYALNTIGEGWVGEEALAIAVYCSMSFGDDWKEAVLASVNHSGDSDSTGSITGAIMGALLGSGSIPGRWVRDVENAKLLEELASRMYSLFRG